MRQPDQPLANVTILCKLPELDLEQFRPGVLQDGGQGE